jgi:hypothetical protein
VSSCKSLKIDKLTLKRSPGYSSFFCGKRFKPSIVKR